jgi:NhaP-type Na+/H+ or K+/H+ antiporter
VLLLILIGLVAGPVTGLVRPELLGATGGVFGTIALVVILLESGTGLDLEVLTRSLGPTLG